MPKMPELTPCFNGSPHDLERLNCIDSRLSDNEMVSTILSLYCRKCGTLWEVDELWPEPVKAGEEKPVTGKVMKNTRDILGRILMAARMRAMEETPDGQQARDEVEALLAILSDQKPPKDA